MLRHKALKVDADLDFGLLADPLTMTIYQRGCMSCFFIDTPLDLFGYHVVVLNPIKNVERW